MALDFIRRRPRTAVAVVVLVALTSMGIVLLRRSRVDPSLVAVVRRGTLTATLVTNGTLRPITSVTYRSPIAGREVEILDLAPEGTRVSAGDLLVQLDTTEVEREIARVTQDLGQAELDFEVASGERDDAEAELRAVSEGEGVLTVAEARSRAQIAQKKVEQLRREHEQLAPLMERGFITRDELANTTTQLEQAEEELTLAVKRREVLEKMSHPREQRRAAVQLAQKESQRGRVQARIQELKLRLQALDALLESCTIYARGPGLVVYEEYFNANPRRKIRVGDRVTSSHGIITIPEVARMIVDTAVDEAQVHRVSPGLPASIRVEAYPEARLTGRVSRIGTLASASVFRPMDGKLFDLAIELDPTTMDLRPEMTVRADIVVGTRENVLLAPVTAVFERNGTFVVYLDSPTGPTERRVDVGASNDTEVEITAGLAEGDRIALVEPAAAAPAPAPAAAPAGAPVMGASGGFKHAAGLP
jgi:multidrug resistance efflux pump